jgi:hypothetical protein
MNIDEVGLFIGNWCKAKNNFIRIWWAKMGAKITALHQVHRNRKGTGSMDINEQRPFDGNVSEMYDRMFGESIADSFYRCEMFEQKIKPRRARGFGTLLVAGLFVTGIVCFYFLGTGLFSQVGVTLWFFATLGFVLLAARFKVK